MSSGTQSERVILEPHWLGSSAMQGWKLVKNLDCIVPRSISGTTILLGFEVLREKFLWRYHREVSDLMVEMRYAHYYVDRFDPDPLYG